MTISYNILTSTVSIQVSAEELIALKADARENVRAIVVELINHIKEGLAHGKN